MRAVFPHVVLPARVPVLSGDDGGNVVAVASRRPIPSATRRCSPTTSPVDQLLTPYG
jgi:hypothetical protein